MYLHTYVYVRVRVLELNTVEPLDTSEIRKDTRSVSEVYLCEQN